MFKKIEKYVERYPKIWYLYVEQHSSHTSVIMVLDIKKKENQQIGEA